MFQNSTVRSTRLIAVCAAAVAAGAGLLVSTAPAAAAATPVAPALSHPSAASTGPVAGTVFTQYTGNMTISQDGFVLENADVHGFVNVTGAHVVIRNSIIRGGATASANTGLVNNYGGSDLTLYHDTLVPEFPSVHINGVHAKGTTTINHSDISGTVDGVDILGSGTTVKYSYIHGLQYYASDPSHGGGPTHNDGIQFFGGAHTLIDSNTFQIDPTTGSALQTSQSLGPISDFVYTNNWVDGGWCSLNFSAAPLPRITGVTLTGNRFGRHQTQAGCAVIANLSTNPMVTSGNVWDDTSQPIVITRGA